MLKIKQFQRSARNDSYYLLGQAKPIASKLYTIQAMADGTWHVDAQLAADEQAALAAAATQPDTLCQRAQHALGLAGIGSRIAPDRSAIGVYVPALLMPSGVTPLVLDGCAPLCWVARAPSEAIAALIAAAIAIMRAAPTPLTHQ